MRVLPEIAHAVTSHRFAVSNSNFSHGSGFPYSVCMCMDVVSSSLVGDPVPIREW